MRNSHSACSMDSMSDNRVRIPDVNSDDEDSLEALCRRLIASDRSAFETIFRKSRDNLLRYAYTIVPGGTVAQDLVQDVFVDLWGRRRRLDPSRPLLPYLYRMTRNRAYRYLRDERSHTAKHGRLSKDATHRTQQPVRPEEELDSDVLARRLDQWIDELPNRQREALLLSRVHALTHQEISSIMDISPRTVNNHLVRALKHLQGRIQAFEPLLLEP